MSKNQITNREGGVTYFTATNVKGELFDCLIDTADEHLINRYTYRIDKAGYLVSTTSKEKKRVNLKLHRVIMRTPIGLCTDHINGNRSDNRRSNLRIANKSENGCNTRTRSDNTSGYKGVHYSNRDNKWRAVIWKNGHHKHAGDFKCPTLAALVYDRAALELHGEFARLNLEGILNGS